MLFTKSASALVQLAKRHAYHHPASTLSSFLAATAQPLSTQHPCSTPSKTATFTHLASQQPARTICDNPRLPVPHLFQHLSQATPPTTSPHSRLLPPLLSSAHLPGATPVNPPLVRTFASKGKRHERKKARRAAASTPPASTETPSPPQMDDGQEGGGVDFAPEVIAESGNTHVIVFNARTINKGVDSTTKMLVADAMCLYGQPGVRDLQSILEARYAKNCVYEDCTGMKLEGRDSLARTFSNRASGVEGVTVWISRMLVVGDSDGKAGTQARQIEVEGLQRTYLGYGTSLWRKLLRRPVDVKREFTTTLTLDPSGKRVVRHEDDWRDYTLWLARFGPAIMGMYGDESAWHMFTGRVRQVEEKIEE